MTSSGWGSRNHALAALGLNVVLLGALAVMVAIIDFVPLEIGEAIVELSNGIASLSFLATIIGALGFLPWLSKTYERASQVASTPELEAERRKGPVAGFFLPFLNFVRPYQAVRALDAALDPDRVPPPPVRLAQDSVASYRDPAPVVMHERRAIPSAPVGLWWTLWIARALGSFATKTTQSNGIVASYDALVCAAAVAACVVVWRISARLDEVERRQRVLADVAP